MALQPYHGRKLFLTRWIVKFIPSDEDPLDFNIRLSGLMTPTPVGPIEDTNEYPRRRKRKYYTFTPYTTDFLETVHGPKLVEFENKETITLVDGMSYEEGIKSGYPASFIDYFRFGFPPTWEFIISQFYLSMHRGIANGEAPLGIKSILKNPSKPSNQLVLQDKDKTKVVNTDHTSVLKERNRTDADNKLKSGHRSASSSSASKGLSRTKSSLSQKDSKLLNVPTCSSSKKDLPNVHQQDKSSTSSTKNNTRPSRTNTRLQKAQRQAELRSSSGANGDGPRERHSKLERSFKQMDRSFHSDEMNEQVKGKRSQSQSNSKNKANHLQTNLKDQQNQRVHSRSQKTSRYTENDLHRNSKDEKNQSKRSQSEKITTKTRTPSFSSEKKLQSQPLKSCLRKGSSSTIEKENSGSTKSSYYNQQHTFRRSKPQSDKVLLNRSLAGCKRHSDNDEDSPSRKNPRQTTGHDYKFSFLPRKRVEGRKDDIVLPKCI
uniref:SANTA domain-containing protein n=1 Tax=Strongyloides papillosus TaxID=174720 RepID=A0A0N5BUJ5_STREA